MGEPIKPVASNWRKTATGHESVPLYDVDPNEAASRIAELKAENALAWATARSDTARAASAEMRVAGLEAKLATAVASLDEAAEYVERFADMRDGDYGGQEPNEAMQLAHSLRQAITDASK